ncbi:hypothetical protein [Gulosibacter sp. 10]|uniref:hypothetical protein n=1 Tax=Gulosibacter sp. 10 TaxID=1255570 RepID=UPI0011249331|nr:hypothetical protein [Gulosibacter sp. 10]
MSDSEPLRGVVARVVSDREVILNKGTDHGLDAGEYVIIIDPDTQSITDPETGENLGGLKRIKAVLRVVESTAKLSLAKTFRTRRVRVSGGLGGAGFGNMFAEPKYETRVETLQLDPQAGLPISEEDSAISLNDPFEVVSAEEAEDTRTVTLWR